MPRRPLADEERALWARVTADVRPMRAPRPRVPSPVTAAPVAVPVAPPAKRLGRVPPVRHVPPAPAARLAGPGATLDGGWDRRLRKGMVAPDRIIDLHGHTLGHAHAALEAALTDAIAGGERVLLVVAGRERAEGPRGGIRRSLGDWLAASRHASRIAAVRAAHPRHGGGGAVYLILRRGGGG